MQQSEILSYTEKLIPAYYSDDFDVILSHMTEGLAPSVKLLVKMELNRIMEPCTKNIDLRGRVQGECREYTLDGYAHWLDDVAFNDYHRYVKKYGGYTQGVWEALYNTKNNFRVMREKGIQPKPQTQNESNPFHVESIQLGYDLKRQENRLKISSQIEIELPRSQSLNAVTVDLSPSGAKFKVPSSFNYKLGETIFVRFVELEKTLDIQGIEFPVEYRILGVDESYENDSVYFLRTVRTSDTDIIDKVIDYHLTSETQKSRHNNQDKIIRARTRAYEHVFLNNANQLPILFNKNELKAVLLTGNNQHIWQYWHDERNLQTLGGLFSPKRMALLTKPGTSGTTATIYSFQHLHQDKKLFFSMIRTEGTPAKRKLFWHLGAKRDSWRVFRLTVSEISEEDRQNLQESSDQLEKHIFPLTHIGFLQEINTNNESSDYLFVDKPRIPSSELNAYRQPRKQAGHPLCIFYDTRSQRKEPRYKLASPVEIISPDNMVISGSTVDLSKSGLSLLLKQPANIRVGQTVHIHFIELKSYSKTVSLERVPYEVIRTDASGRRIQLAIESSSFSVRIVAFLNKLINSNQDRLAESKELLPGEALLESLHDILLNNVYCAPIYVARKGVTLTPKAIGVTYPLPGYLSLLAKLGTDQTSSLEPIFKGHTKTLMAEPMKHVEREKPISNEIYISVKRFGAKVHSVETKLRFDFENTKERIDYIRDALLFGEIYVLHISGSPIFKPLTPLLQKDLDELLSVSKFHAKSIEKEINSLVGYAQIIDITEEVLIRLELSS
ncbi:PilZ domain-containing protein [Vibrio salinus]|uniref:PilZ domain-containing protein n=1 Tax=Vibrio salinus TaxID=2899784 RepID=UPI001E52AAB5|nr:PilZ domain-containing protein [Vibrio salinus]MCE0494307.1 PilZ domain-containing protein [Vibrio salinus]